MREAFSYMFKDRAFVQKAALYLCLFLLTYCCIIFSQAKGIPLIGSIAIFAVGILLCFVLSGYFFSLIRFNIENKENSDIPKINVFENLATGFKWFLAALIFLVAVIVIVSLFVALVLLLYKSGLKMTSFFMFLPVYVIVLGGLMIVFPALIGIFAKSGEITSLFRIKKAFEVLCANAKTYFIGYIVYILTATMIYLLNGLFYDFSTAFMGSMMQDPVLFNLVFICFNTLLSSYLIFVLSYIFAQMVNVKEIEE